MFIRKMSKSVKESSKVASVINAETLHCYLDFSKVDFLDEIDILRKSHPERMAALEQSHFCLLWMFDLLDFSF
jgi:hypothetical protein